MQHVHKQLQSLAGSIDASTKTNTKTNVCDNSQHPCVWFKWATFCEKHMSKLFHTEKITKTLQRTTKLSLRRVRCSQHCPQAHSSVNPHFVVLKRHRNYSQCCGW